MTNEAFCFDGISTPAHSLQARCLVSSFGWNFVIPVNSVDNFFGRWFYRHSFIEANIVFDSSILDPNRLFVGIFLMPFSMILSYFINKQEKSKLGL